MSIAAGILISGLLYFNSNQYNKKLTWLLAALRTMGFAAVVFLLLAPFVTVQNSVLQKQKVVVLLDNSQSVIANADSANLYAYFANKLPEIVENVPEIDPVFLTFGSEISTGTPSFNQPETNINHALNQAFAQVGAENLGAIVLATDGIVTRGINPLYFTEKNVVPIYTIGIGDTVQQTDLAVGLVRAPEFVFRGDKIVASTTISASHCNQQNVVVELVENGKTIQQKELKITGDKYAKNLQFAWQPKTVGMHVYTVRCTTLASEKNTVNNASQFAVEVVENRKQIVVTANAPHPDVAAVVEALKRVDAYSVQFAKPKQATQFVDSAALVVVFVQPGMPQNSISNLLKKYAGPLWAIVHPQANGALLEGKMGFISKIGREQSLSMEPKFDENFGIFQLQKETITALKELGSLQLFTGNIQVSVPYSTFLKDSQNKPVAAYGSVNEQPFALFNFSGLWQWRMRDFKLHTSHKNVDAWLQRTAQYLTQANQNKRLQVQHAKTIAAGQDLRFAATVYTAAMEPALHANVQVEISDKNNEALNFDLLPQKDGYLSTLSGLAPGSYTAKTTATLGDETLREVSAFTVVDQSVEQQNTRANFSMLKQLSQASGGVFFPEYASAALAEALQKNNQLKPIKKLQTRAISLTDIWWIFVSILVIFSTEWILRRYFGTV